MRKEKGITLIALIITIIILLILAVVTIGSIKNSKIIDQAENAAKDYNKGKTEEQGILDHYEKLIEDNIDSGFKKFVLSTVASSKKIIGDYYNLVAIRNIIKQEYPAAFVEMNIGGLELGNFSSNTENEFEEGIKELVTKNGTNLLDIYNMILHYGDDLLVLDIKGNLEEYNGSAIPMKEQEAQELFVYRAPTSNEIKNSTEKDIVITGYLGTDTTVKIPAVLYDENGNITKKVVGIGDSAFLKSNGVKTLFISLFGMSESDYKTKTINEIWNILFDETYTGTSVSGDSKDLADKKTAIIEFFEMIGVGKNIYEFDENLMLYVWIGSDEKNTMPKPIIDIETVYIPIYVKYIGEKAFADQTKLTRVYAGLSDIPTMSNNVFSGCTSLANNYMRLDKEDFKATIGYNWGAPESTKIYYVKDYETTFGREYDENVFIEYTK